MNLSGVIIYLDLHAGYWRTFRSRYHSFETLNITSYLIAIVSSTHLPTARSDDMTVPRSMPFPILLHYPSDLANHEIIQQNHNTEVGSRNPLAAKLCQARKTHLPPIQHLRPLSAFHRLDNSALTKQVRLFTRGQRRNSAFPAHAKKARERKKNDKHNAQAPSASAAIDQRAHCPKAGNPAPAYAECAHVYFDRATRTHASASYRAQAGRLYQEQPSERGPRIASVCVPQ
jgi:hypothetical protein